MKDGKKGKPAYDIKHILTLVRVDDSGEVLRPYIEIVPYGRVYLLIQKETMAILIDKEGEEEEYHRHYGKIQFRILEGPNITMALWELCKNNQRVLIGVDGRLRISGDGDLMQECIERYRPCPYFHYIKIHELVIFPRNR